MKALMDGIPFIFKNTSTDFVYNAHSCEEFCLLGYNAVWLYPKRQNPTYHRSENLKSYNGFTS
jgi:hypothetical protein